MEGRTKFNYGYNSGLITMKDINYMFNIINSNLSEEEKAIKLYSFCNLHSLISNRDLYNTLELEQVEKFKELIRVYRNYEAKRLFKSAKNPYKCTLEEIALRLNQISSSQYISGNFQCINGFSRRNASGCPSPVLGCSNNSL